MYDNLPYHLQIDLYLHLNTFYRSTMYTYQIAIMFTRVPQIDFYYSLTFATIIINQLCLESYFKIKIAL